MIDSLDNAPDLWRGLFPWPVADSHKYSRGTLLVRGGAVMTGAARLTARAAQRMGAGLVIVAAPVTALPIYAAALESVIVRACDGLQQWQALLDDARQPAVAIGCGLGIGAAQAAEGLAALAVRRPCVVDADGLTNFSDDPALLCEALHDQCVITPHEGEFARVFGPLRADERIALAQEVAARAGCVVVLKSSETVIAAPDGQIVVNRNAPPWLATAGSGDVLAGMIAGLLAQKMPVFWASCAAVWCHGHIAARHGAGLIAEDIVAGIPAVLTELAG